MTTASEWATSFLQYLGFTPTPTNVAQVAAWEQAESGGVGSYNNPLNTTLTMPGSWGVNYNGGHPVQGYPTMAEGIAADATALKGNYRNYDRIRADLQAGNASNAQFAADVGGSPWGTPASHIASILGTTPAASTGATATNLSSPVLNYLAGAAGLPSGASIGHYLMIAVGATFGLVLIVLGAERATGAHPAKTAAGLAPLAAL